MKNTEELISGIARAIASRTQLPSIDIELTLSEAYALQHELTKQLCPGGRGGIKAGVTAPGAQKHFGVDHGLIGSLYGDSRLGDGCRLPFTKGRMLECELAVLIDSDGTPKAIAPAIEVVLVQFARPEDMTAANLVLSNLGADGYIVGQFQAWSPPYSEVSVALRRNDEIINQAAMAESLGGPEKSVPWICQEARSRRFAISADTLLLTGACGKVLPAEVGHYSADFGPLGQMRFEIFDDDEGRASFI
jgi:2-keto-4-pentenoate hydratase